jgi:hypothetical protein
MTKKCLRAHYQKKHLPGLSAHPRTIQPLSYYKEVPAHNQIVLRRTEKQHASRLASQHRSVKNQSPKTNKIP